eukprot:CAMPEP_0194751866 /NCGR_PEP_ID=MMETSP0323_2-20130528/5796_1 /TAXON_ID=2866 ORGANISM="Crypthecodinium cohnii, Strain Seligo" /NCGR_SAMPLE_ID=MMETSP0323_2 /ASSEMBLY_ACC=CAM_ASM_000346 /LENGTH=43 /DNA_ID= /DNA_START= /DNA_END= /DNA_ORIENTATION=
MALRLKPSLRLLRPAAALRQEDVHGDSLHDCFRLQLLLQAHLF